jgi:DNA topoisomerase I
VGRISKPFSKYLYNDPIPHVLDEKINVDELYADGFWITLRGKPMFIGGPSRKVRPSKNRKDVLKKKIRKDKKGKPILGKDGKPQKYDWVPKAWEEQNERFKFAVMVSLAKNRDRVERMLTSDLNRKQQDKKTVVAGIALMMLDTGMRVGGGRGKGKTGATIKRDSEGNQSVVDTYGATTLQMNHLRFEGDKAILDYVGKKGMDRHVETSTPKVVEFLKKSAIGKSGTDRLFEYDGEPISQKDISKRMKKFDPDYTPKVMRTLKANEVASNAGLDIIDRDIEIPDTPKKKEALIKKLIKEIGDKTSAVLGNESAVALKNYINPKLVEAIMEEVGLK